MAAATATARQGANSGWTRALGDMLYLAFALIGAFLLYKWWWYAGTIWLFFWAFVYILTRLKPEYRSITLFIFFILLITAFISGYIQGLMAHDQRVITIIRENPALSSLIRTYSDTVVWSFLIGLLIALFLVFIPLLLLSFIGSNYILALHKIQGIGRWDAMKYLFSLMLGINQDFIVVENGQAIITKEAGVFAKVGGPGKLIIKEGNAVVLEHGGKISRIVNAGVVKLKPMEKIRNIFVLSPHSNWGEFEDVLTKDRIPLKIEMGIGYQIEPASEVDKRPESHIAPNGEALSRKLDDGLFQVYEGTIRKAALMSQVTSPDQRIFQTCEDVFCWDIAKTEWQKVAGGVPEGELRDYIMSHDFDELFELVDSADGEEPKVRVKKRKIYEIEQAILEQIRPGKAKGLGVFVRAVDIRKIEFPLDARNLLLKHWGMPWEQGIQNISAESSITNAQLKAQAMVIIARAQAQVRILEGQGEGEARAAFFREVLREMKREGVLGDEEMIREVLRQLINTMVSIKDLEAYVKLAGLLEPLSRRYLAVGSEEGSQAG